MPNGRRNPLSPCALTDTEIREEMKFLWYTPGDDDSLKWGVFTSEPYIEDDEHYVVACTIDGVETTVELTDMGIVQSRYEEDVWAKCLTKAY
jgi:hypothetical protein